MGKRICATLFALLLGFGGLFPAYATAAVATSEPPVVPDGQVQTDQETPLEGSGPDGGDTGANPPNTPPKVPEFSAELVLGIDGLGLYGTLSQLTPDMLEATPHYSFDGVAFTAEPFNAMELPSGSPEPFREQYFWPMESPLLEYIGGDVDCFYFKLEITYGDGSTAFTQTKTFERAGPAPLPKEYQLASWYGPGVLDQALGRGQYHFTVPSTAMAEELAALLPDRVPVELQIYRQGDPTRHTALVEYEVSWPEQLLFDGSTDADVIAASITPPKTCTVTLGTNVYEVAPPAILPENGAELRATFHPATAAEATQVLLSVDNNWEKKGIRATFPQKPTGATAIIPEYSLDGRTGWVPLADVLPSAPLEGVPPRFESYTLGILDGAAPPLADYASGAIAGFYVRLRVEGGVLAGTTQAVAWPASYDYVPPRDDSQDEGSGGNNGNIGSGNTEGNSSSNGGQRPDLPEEGAVEPPPTPVPPSLEQPVVGPVLPPEPVPSPEPTPGERRAEEGTAPQRPAPEPTPLDVPEVGPTETIEPPPAQTPVPEAEATPSPVPTAPLPEKAPAPTLEASPVRPPHRPVTIPVAAAVLSLTVGGGIAVCVGASSGGTAATAGCAKHLAALKRFLLKK